MNYLLDVNALLSWGHARAQHNTRFHEWAAKIGQQNLYTCAIVELGFLRISMQVYGLPLDEAQAALAQLKQKAGGFIAEAPSPALPAWSSTGSKTTDAYLCQLAGTHRMRLATFDNGIKDATAYLIS